MSEDLAQDELSTLKARADRMGVTYHPNIGLEKLKEKLAAATASEDDTPAAAPVVDPAVETIAQKRRRLRNECSKLVRIRLTCMNPAKKDWPGEIITAGNALVGSFKKHIPFVDADEGYHVPHILYEVLKERQCQIFTTIKTKNGVSVRKGKLIKEFAIEVLDPLTPAELKELARLQAMTQAAD